MTQLTNLTPLLEAEASQTGSLIMTVGMVAVLGLVFYFFMYRPQKKQEKETKAMLDSIELGDVVSTVGGIVGVVVRIKGEMMLIETGADRTRLQIQKWAVRQVEEKAHPDEEAHRGSTVDGKSAAKMKK